MDQKDPITEIDTGSSPVSRLKAHVAKWQEATDSKYILDVVRTDTSFLVKLFPNILR
ncbi:hypothetical protein DPMN_080576 [Dreissena polymorpha]|uniref:Uncharacterized protein n=1 Tax=Dreissena polymorpha TaxID=45954 RepID=A0A9D3YVB2_DREPO|nr:hypothetical protein DPMN_080576 [Dreissena polymorpha]